MFFFFKQKTAYEMRISDWSSDVCSSDLSMNIDDTRGKARPVHSILLGAGILIVEHLCNLAAVPDEGFEFSAVPPKFCGVGTFPVRALARLNGVRSEERRVGTEGVSPCSSRCSPYH